MTGPTLNPLLQVSPFANDHGEVIGRDPRAIPIEDWAGSCRFVGLKAIRAKCFDCTGTGGKVRKCVQTDCPIWPLRMGAVPKGYRMAIIKAAMSGAGPAGNDTAGTCPINAKPAHDAGNVLEGGA